MPDGHTKNYKKQMCKMCSNERLWTKVQDNNVKCVNCTGIHPSNYRGCVVHKQMQQQLYPTLKEETILQPGAPVIPTQRNNPGMTYAHLTKSNLSNNNYETTPPLTTTNNNLSELERMFSKLIEQMGTMLNLLVTVIAKLTWWKNTNLKLQSGTPMICNNT